MKKLAIIKESFNRYVDRPLNQLDNGNLFKRGIFYYLLLTGLAILLAGIYFVLSGLFGDTGYFSTGLFREIPKEMYDQNPDMYPGMFMKVRSVFASIFTFVLSISLLIVVGSIFYKRASDLNNSEYNGLLEFLYQNMVPKVIKIYGECLALLPFFIGIVGFISILFVADPYNPLDEFYREMYSSVGLRDVYRMMDVGVYGISDFGDYVEAFFQDGLGGLLMSVLISFSILISTFIALEVYSYVVSILANLIKFIPRFALPIWVQKSNRYKNRPNVDIKDL